MFAKVIGGPSDASARLGLQKMPPQSSFCKGAILANNPAGIFDARHRVVGKNLGLIMNTTAPRKPPAKQVLPTFALVRKKYLHNTLDNVWGSGGRPK